MASDVDTGSEVRTDPLDRLEALLREALSIGPDDDPVGAVQALADRAEKAEARLGVWHEAVHANYRVESALSLDTTNPRQMIGAVVRSNVQAELARAQEADARADAAEQRAEKAEAEVARVRRGRDALQVVAAGELGRFVDALADGVPDAAVQDEIDRLRAENEWLRVTLDAIREASGDPQGSRGSRATEPICAGCRVRPPHEHRCHYGGEPRSAATCMCDLCREPTAAEIADLGLGATGAGGEEE